MGNLAGVPQKYWLATHRQRDAIPAHRCIEHAPIWAAQIGGCCAGSQRDAGMRGRPDHIKGPPSASEAQIVHLAPIDRFDIIKIDCACANKRIIGIIQEDRL